MAELKTQKNSSSVNDYLNTVEDEQKRIDSFALVKLFEDITKEKAIMWGASIIGFGQYHYKSERSAQEGDWPLTGFSPRKQNITIYIMPGFKNYQKELDKIGKYKNSVSCLYIKKLADIDIEILKKMIAYSVEEMKKQYNVK
jgi:hypothetical protein